MNAYKLMLLGDIGVGKSSLAQRLVFDRFSSSYKPTIGVDVYRYVVPERVERDEINLIIWDTDGNFGDTIFRQMYMKQAHAALIIGDLSRQPTLKSMIDLSDAFRSAFPGRHVGYVLNKTDLIKDRNALMLPPQLNNADIPAHFTSALNGEAVADAFAEAADSIVRRLS